MRVTDTNRSIPELAKGLMKDLQRRSGTLEQSKLGDVSRWAGLEGKPLCNVYVNVLHTGPKPDRNPTKERAFEPVKVSLSLGLGTIRNGAHPHISSHIVSRSSSMRTTTDGRELSASPRSRYFALFWEMWHIVN